MNISKFEDYDDDYDVARDELFSNPNAFIAFRFADYIVKEDNLIRKLIEAYNETYKTEKEWSGGPVNDKFIDIFHNMMSFEDLEEDTWYDFKVPHSSNFYRKLKRYKPSIQLFIPTKYGTTSLGFGCSSQEVRSIILSLIRKDENFGRSSINKIPENYSVIGRDYAFDDSGVVNQILNIMKKIYKDGLTLSKVKLDLNLSHISI